MSLPRVAFSVQEVAEMVGSHYHAVLAAIHHNNPSRVLLAQRVGKEYRIHTLAIDDWLMRTCHPKKASAPLLDRERVGMENL